MGTERDCDVGSLTLEEFNKLAEETRITKSRLMDEAIEDLLKKYEKRMAE